MGNGGGKSTNPVLGATENSLGGKEEEKSPTSLLANLKLKKKKKNENSCFVGGRGNDDSGGCGLQSGETDEARPGPSRDLRPSS